MSLGVLETLDTYVIMECVKRDLWPLLTHINDYNMFIGVLGPLETYVIMECVKRDHRSSYDPFQPI